MSTLTNDIPAGPTRAPRPALSGFGFALASALSFGLSGTLARGLLDTGWSPGAVVLVRIALAALVVAPFAVVAMRGRWHLVRRSAGAIIAYGALAVAGAQFCYFSAVQYMEVAPALLIEYAAPAAVVLWLWLRHGHRPGRLTLLGVAVAGLGLVLVLDVLSGAEVSLPGVLWALGAMIGCAVYFVMSADESHGLPPITLAAGGLVVGAAVLGGLALVGVLPMSATTDAAVYSTTEISWWIPLVLLGLVTAALAYTTGIAAVRRLGSRVASFVGLTEVLAALGWAWLVLGEFPAPIQLVGGLLIVAGVVAVKLGERGSGESLPDVSPAHVG